ncbi:unnamed protein product [Gordionus sp. m RMFG-2023]|uniref:dicarboxylate carrier SLC25A8-like n=1 Tax=Gordionus sp. m RMFG-2023 TaxID=3053472 RepID=UPI0030E4BC7F
MTVNSISSDKETIGVRFISAGISACVADFITFPLDTAKVRLQIQGENSNILSNKLTKPNVINLDQMPKNVSACITKSTYPNKTNLIITRALYKDINISIPNNNINVSTKVYNGLYGTIKTIVKQEGFKALYNGLVAGLQRQMSFASIRIGMYETVRTKYESILTNVTKSKTLQKDHNIKLRIMAGITTGGLAVLIAQPADVVKVRLQAQIPQLNKDLKSGGVRYNGAMHAYKTIYRTDGLKGLWKGILPNMTRNAVINACELVGYDIFKQYILRNTRLSDNFPCHFLSAFGAGFITTLIASPIDVVKTRFMNSASNNYKGSLHCAYRMLTKEGPVSFYKGFTPSFMRLASWNIVMFVCYEQLKRQILYLKQSVH